MELESHISLNWNPNNFTDESELHQHAWEVLRDRYDYETAEKLYLEYFYPLE